jgi:predicted DNA-binding transcriptional regulator YafY
MNIEKFKYFIHLVEKERTGNASDLALKLEVSERTIYSYVRVLRVELNAPIAFNRYKQTYFFSKPGRLLWEWKLK